MRRVSIIAAVLAVLAVPVSSGVWAEDLAPAAPPPDLDRYVARAMQAFGAPGMSLAIVQSGKTLVAKGYGVRSIATRAPVTAGHST